MGLRSTMLSHISACRSEFRDTKTCDKKELELARLLAKIFILSQIRNIISE